ncbi:MAG: hypothetical protein M3022_06190 [Actinomycetota bacterium]|nr:hypothetical protein [Actinomycetota bacterium]
MNAGADADADVDVREAYLSLVQGALLGSFAPREELIAAPERRRRAIDRILSARGLHLARRHVERLRTCGRHHRHRGLARRREHLHARRAQGVGRDRPHRLGR